MLFFKGGPVMEFMGISVGILALICAFVLLFGRQGTRKLLGWSLGLIMLGAACVVAAVWAIEHNRQTRPLSDAEVGLAPNNTATAPPFDPSKPYEVVRPPANTSSEHDAACAWAKSNSNTAVCR
jgi:hypothetical protein